MTTDTIKREYKYMIQSEDGIHQYTINESERKFLQNSIKKGILKGRIRDFIYNTNITFSLNVKSKFEELSPKAKKAILDFASSIVGYGELFHTQYSETTSLWRGDFGLSIADLKSFKTPLYKNGSSYIVIDIHTTINFQYKPL